MRTRRPSALLAAAAFVVAGPVGAALAQSQAPRIARPVQATVDDTDPTRTYTAPDLVVHPDDPRIVYGATQSVRDKTCSLIRSEDGGESWALLPASPSPAAYPLCTANTGMALQAPLAISPSGTLLYAMSGYDLREGEGSGDNMSIIVARSDDGGASWEQTVVSDARGNTEEAVVDQRATAIVFDPTDPDRVYVAWKARFPNVEDRPTKARIAVSEDGGATFGEARPLPDADTTVGFQGIVDLAVTDAGTLYSLHLGAGPDDGGHLVLGTSKDRGATFETSYVHADQPSGWRATQILGWSPQGGPDGSLHIVYEDKDQPSIAADRDIYYTRSTDGGATFSDPVILNDDDPAELYGNFTPNIAVAPDGRLDVVWWDFRLGSAVYANDVYYTFSTDNGATWSDNTRITDRSINRKLGPWSNGFDVRQPPGVAAAGQLSIIGWDDTREGSAEGQAQDVYVGAAQFEPLPPPPGTPAIRYVVGGLVGLLAAGLVLTLAGLGMRQRSPAGADERVTAGRP